MFDLKKATVLLFAGATTVFQLCGQTAAGAKAGPDVLIFIDGEKLIGHLESATGASVVFKSDMAGEVTVDWSKIQELHSAGKFAVIPKGAKPKKRADENGDSSRNSDRPISMQVNPSGECTGQPNRSSGRYR